MKIIAPFVLAGVVLFPVHVSAQSSGFSLKKILKDSVKEAQQAASKSEQAGVAGSSATSAPNANPRQEGFVEFNGLPRQGGAGLLLDSNSMAGFLASIRKPEIGGVSLGMNINEALPIVKKLNAAYRIEALKTFSYSFKGLVAKSGPANRVALDQMTLYVNEAGTVWLVSRSITLPDNQPLLLDTYRNALYEKYDAPNVSVVERDRKSFAHYVWSYDVKGQQFASHLNGFKGDPCATPQYGMSVPVSNQVDLPNGFRNTCAMNLVTTAQAKLNNQELVEQYTITMYSPSLIRDVNVTEAQNADYLKKKREAEEKARANKPQF